MIVSTSLFDKVKNFEIMNFDISDHLPITCTINVNEKLDYPNLANISRETKSRTKYKWCEKNRGLYVNQLMSHTVVNLIERFENVVYNDQCKAIEILNEILEHAGSSMKIRKYLHN